MNLEFRLQDVLGNRYVLKNPMSFSCVKSKETPADNLKVSFFQKDFQTISTAYQPEIKSVDIFEQSNLIFKGICDQQSIIADSSGGRVEIEARGLGALLLDNEALPQEYYNASLNQIFKNHIEPYEFFNKINHDISLPLFAVSKGMSQWDVFSSFCFCATGKHPFISGNEVMLEATSPSSHFIESVFTEGISEIRHVIRRCDTISSVFIRDENGSYSSQVTNNPAIQAGISRTRYLIPPPQWATQTMLNAHLKLKDSTNNRNRWTLKLAGLHHFMLDDRISLKDYFEGLSVYEIQLSFNQTGTYTKLVLAL